MKRIFLLFGNVGAGKTTFVKQFLNSDIVNSPTFTLCNEYELNDKRVAHFDFYNRDIINYKILNYAICNCDLIFIEWPERLDLHQLKQFQKEIVMIYL